MPFDNKSWWMTCNDTIQIYQESSEYSFARVSNPYPTFQASNAFICKSKLSRIDEENASSGVLRFD